MPHVKRFRIALTIRQWFVHGQQQSPEVISPAEPARFRRDRLHTNYRNPAAVLFQTRSKLIADDLLGLESERCLSDAGRPKHEYQRVWLRLGDGGIGRAHVLNSSHL